MDFIANILKQFNSKQRMFILILLLVFTSMTSIITSYLSSGYNGCEPLIKQNQELLNDYIQISKLVVKQQTSMTDSTVDNSLPKSSPSISPMDSIMKIVNKHIK